MPESVTDPVPDSDDFPDDPETGPMRRCLVHRESRPVEGMIRFVVGPDQMLVPDLAASLPGRGFWLSADYRALDEAISKNLFARAARQKLVVPPDLAAMMTKGMTNRCRDILALTRRAGQAVIGFEKVREKLRGGGVTLLVIASDAAEDGRQKITALADAISDQTLPVVSPLDGATMGQVFGRDHIVHVALSSGGLATRMRHESARLAGLKRP